MNYIIIDSHECKGCRVCIAACPNRCIRLGNAINEIGYQYAEFIKGAKCTACGLCFYSCPEFGAITVYKDEEEYHG